MSTENDTSTGDGGLSMDEAAKAYVKATTTEAASDGQAEEDDLDTGTATDDALEADADSEDEGEPTDDEGQADDDETDDEPDSDQGRFVAANGKVRLPDGSVATVNDLIQGNLRDRDYRQKTMETAELKRSVTTQSDALKQQEYQLAQQREYVASLVQSIIPQEPDPTLAQTDPYAYTTQKANFDAWQRHSYYLANEQTAAQQRWAEEAETAKKEKVQAEWNALLEKAPALKDQKRFTSFANDLKEHGVRYGFTVPEMAEALAVDHRMALVMRSAIAWDKLQASKPKMQSKVEGRPPVQKSGKRLSSGDQKARSATVAMDRLKQSGSVDDAARAYLLASRKG